MVPPPVSIRRRNSANKGNAHRRALGRSTAPQRVQRMSDKKRMHDEAVPRLKTQLEKSAASIIRFYP